MSMTVINQQTKLMDFEKEYDEIVKRALEFSKLEPSKELSFFNVNENFKKFSLYTDPNSVTSFDTNASL
jgi:hypothetical protein